jgi:hypothetical protein
MDWTVATYLAYLLTVVPITIWVATTLVRNGRIFLGDVFGHETDLADAVNKLLVVGFYLINLGFVMLYLRTNGRVMNLTDLLETVSVKIGVVMLILGVIHFINVMVFTSMRRKGRAEAERERAAAAWAQHQYPAQPRH